MAFRLVYVYDEKENQIEVKKVEFTWHAGGTLKSNRESIKELHKVIEEEGIGRALDLSVNTEGKLARSLIYNSIFDKVMYGKEKITLPIEIKNLKLREQYLIIAGINRNKELSDFILQYNVFTNISYVPGKEDLSTAKICCVYKYLVSNSLIEEYLKYPDKVLIKEIV